MQNENGHLPTGWKSARLWDIAEVERGKFTHRPRNAPEFYGGQTPFVQTGDVAESGKYLHGYSQTLSEKGLSVSRVFPSGTVLMVIAGSVGEVTITDFPVAFPDSIVGLRPKPDYSSEFLLHLLRHIRPQIERISTESAQANLSLELIRGIQIAVPPTHVCSLTAKILDACENAIEQTWAVIDQTRKLKSALLQDLLTNGLPGRHTKFRNFDGLGTFPSNWSRVRLGDIIPHWQYGISEALVDSGTLPCFRMNNLRDGRLVAAGLKYAMSPAENLTRYILRVGDLLFNRTNSRDLVGRVGIFDLPSDFVFASYLVQMRVDSQRVDSAFLNLLLNTSKVQGQIRLLATPGVSQSNINVENMKRFTVPLPQREEQVAIVRLVAAVESREVAETHKVMHLQHAKAALSQSLLTGRVRVPAKGDE